MNEKSGVADVSALGEAIPELDGLVGMTAVTSGGFSVIYQAFQPALNRTVAIKIMTTDGVDRRDRERFSREMGLTGKLGAHPHIVDVYQHGISRDGQPYLMMPWYDGGSLADGLRDSGPMPPDVLLRVGIKVASGLGYAHRHGVLHRDVKPGNILLTALNEPILADFGIAVDARQAGNATVAWTPNHAAPEVLSYEEPTPRSDIWALASTLYTALAGRPPYPVDPGNTLISIQQRFRSAPPPFVRTDVPASLSDLLARALAPSPEDRPADVGEFIAGMQAVERELGLAITIPPGPAPVAELVTPQQEAVTFSRPEVSRSVQPAPSVRPIQSSRSAQPSRSVQSVQPSLRRQPSVDPEPSVRPDASLRPPSAIHPDPSDSSWPGPAEQSWSGRQASPFLPADGTEIPDSPTILVRDPVRKKPQWSWKRRLLTTVLGGLSTVVLALVSLVLLAPDDRDKGTKVEETPAFVAPVVSGLRATDRSPTSITIAWHTAGPYQYEHRVVIEDGKTTWLKDQQVQAGSAALTDLEPGTKYCLTVDAFFRTAETAAAESDSQYAYSSSERKCFSTRK